MSITTLLNDLDRLGVFSYVLPFLLIFSVVFAILKKSGILSRTSEGGQGQPGTREENNAILAIIAASVALLSLQYDAVSIFFSNIFPKFGIGLSIILVLLILASFFYPRFNASENWVKWTGFVIGVGVILIALFGWDTWIGYGYGFDWLYYSESFWTIVVIAAIILIIYLIVRGGGGGRGVHLMPTGG